MSTLDELVTPLTVDEAKTAIYSALAARGVTTTDWKPGAVVRTIIAALAIMLSAFSELQANLARSGFLDLASGVWLTWVAYYVYGVTRDVGSFASGTITADNSGGGIYSGVAGDLIVLNPTTNKAYRNTAAFSIGALATGVDIAVEAVELGSESTSAAGTITQLVTSLPGVTITNAAALVGTNEESDALLRLRCRESLGRLSPNGPRDAYAYFARSAVDQDGNSIGVTRVRTVPDGFGTVTIYCATASGGVTGDPDDPTTDLGAIAKAIRENVVPISVTDDVQSATSLSVPYTYELWVPDDIGMTTAQVQAAVSAALVSFTSSQPIGGEVIAPPAAGKIYLSAIDAAIAGALPVNPIRIVITAPAADVTVAASEAPVAGTVTPVAVHFVSRYVVT